MKRYGIALAIFALWLAGWIVLSWPAIQDDALIHLRYAENLRHFHFITYDGIRPNFGTSSLLYVTLLAALTAVTSSPELPRLISSIFHVAMFGCLAWLFFRKTSTSSRAAQLLSLILLALLIAPSSIRWLDDGMETGIVLCFTSLLAWLAFNEAREATTTASRFAGMVVLGYFLVLLRTELAMLAAIAFAAIVAGRIQRSGRHDPGTITRIAVRASHLLIGCALACATIFLRMGVLLPDTAVAKAEGLHAWKNVLVATAVVLVSSFAVGIGLAAFWLITLCIVLLRRRLNAAAALVNLVFPTLLGLTMVRGQAVQGARYLLWAFLFPTIWNILLLSLDEDRPARLARLPLWIASGFAILLLIELPFESRVMYRVLTTRAATMREFEGQHLEALSGLTAVSMDIGYIGYFTHAKICDMSGLVNGRAVARMAPQARVLRCAEEHPDFAFGNPDQLDALSRYLDMRGWRACSEYDFVNVRSPDTHYLAAPPTTARAICGATARPAGADVPLDTIVPQTRIAPALLPQAH